MGYFPKTVKRSHMARSADPWAIIFPGVPCVCTCTCPELRPLEPWEGSLGSLWPSRLPAEVGTLFL